MSLAENDYCLPNFFGTLAAMTETDPDLTRFGSIVRTRREELGIQQEDMGDHGGPSSTTMSRIERGAALPAAKTLRKLDTGLRWQVDSAKRTLAGGDPTPLAPGTTTQKPLRPVGQTSATHPNMSLADMLNVLDNIASALEALRQVKDLPGPQQAKLEAGRAKLGNTVSLLVMACELVGEALADEDITDSLPELIARLEVHQQHLSALIEIAERIYASLKEKNDDLETPTKSDASSKAAEVEEVKSSTDPKPVWSVDDDITSFPDGSEDEQHGTGL